MKIKKQLVLMIAMIFGIQQISIGRLKLIRKTYQSSGFWVTESQPGSRETIVSYNDSNASLISKKTESGTLDITRSSVKRYLNRNLQSELSKRFNW